MQGLGANDTMFGALGSDTLFGNQGQDTLWGDDGTHSGPGGDDTLFGGAGDDALIGEGGRDLLIGQSGADRFVFDATSLLDGAAGILDQISDFEPVDQLDASAITVAGGAPSSAMRAIQDPSNTFAILQVDQDGPGGSAGWIPVARIDAVGIGDQLTVRLAGGGSGAITVLASAGPGALGRPRLPSHSSARTPGAGRATTSTRGHWPM